MPCWVFWNRKRVKPSSATPKCSRSSNSTRAARRAAWWRTEKSSAAVKRASSATRLPSLTVKCPPCAASRMKWKKSRPAWNAASAWATSTNTRQATSSNATRWKKSSKRCNPKQESYNRDGRPFHAPPGVQRSSILSLSPPFFLLRLNQSVHPSLYPFI